MAKLMYKNQQKIVENSVFNIQTFAQ